MDAAEHMRSAARRIEAARDMLVTAFKELDAAAEMAQHAVAHWTGELRTPVEAVLPSQLPDRALGPALAKVRGFLCRAPGQPVDPEFDRVVGGLGVAAARLVAERHLHRGTDVAWIELARSLADRPGPAAERME